MAINDIAAPLQRKVVKKKKTPSHIPGIPHQVEGRKTLKQKGTTPRGGLLSGLSDQLYNKQEADKFDLATTRRRAEDKARGRIKPILDPDAGAAARRKRAARRRMGGRMGTILTLGGEKESLG